MTVTLTNGQGGIGDWLAFALSTAPNTSYYTYTYVGLGVKSRTWTITAPTTPGVYEFRLFFNDGVHARRDESDGDCSVELAAPGGTRLAASAAL